MAEELVLDAEQAAKNAKRAMILTVIAVLVAIAVLAIDNTVKRGIVAEARKAQAILDEAKKIAEGARDGATEAGETGTAPGPVLDGGGGVVHDGPAGEVLGQAENGAGPAPAKRPVRAPRGSSGND